MARFWGVAIGPFVVGSVSGNGRKPRRSAGERLVVWLIVGALFLPGAPIVGILIIVGALLTFVALAVAATDRKDHQS